MSEKKIKFPGWVELRGKTGERLKKPVDKPSFILYFFFIVIVGGGLGWIEPIGRSILTGSPEGLELHKSWIAAMYAYSLAITAAAAVDFLLSEEKNHDLLMLFISGAIIVTLCSAASALCIGHGYVLSAGFFAFGGLFFSLSLWWLGNSDNPKLVGTAVPLNVTGGSTDNIKGSVVGVKV